MCGAEMSRKMALKVAFEVNGEENVGSNDVYGCVSLYGEGNSMVLTTI